jgi:hypothetical protein
VYPYTLNMTTENSHNEPSKYETRVRGSLLFLPFAQTKRTPQFLMYTYKIFTWFESQVLMTQIKQQQVNNKK